MARTAVQNKANGRGKGGRGVSKVPPNETNRQRFTRIAEPRVTAILARLVTLSRMVTGKGKYDYDDADVDAIRDTLIKGVNDMAARLRRAPVKQGFTFAPKDDTRA
jgi:hypothetical protein